MKPPQVPFESYLPVAMRFTAGQEAAALQIQCAWRRALASTLR